MLDYKLLEAFAAVASEGGFEKGAKVLHLTQSAVSQRVKLLEEQTGRILLVRSNPPRPTLAGREMLRHFRQVKRLEDDLGAGFGPEEGEYTSLPVALNADSLATWFLPVVEEFLHGEKLVLDLSIDDQAETHKLLKDGEVLGCVSSRPEPFQGCRVEYLGTMEYRLYGSPEYAARWFPHGVTEEAAKAAPVQIFNRKDVMHQELLDEAVGKPVSGYPSFYLPSSESFSELAIMGLASAMLPPQQSDTPVAEGKLVDLAPGYAVPVPLYWHCWNLDSGLLQRFTAALVDAARKVL